MGRTKCSLGSVKPPTEVKRVFPLSKGKPQNTGFSQYYMASSLFTGLCRDTSKLLGPNLSPY